MQLWTPNQSLKNGRFIVQKVLGGGGFGVTYSALEQRTGKLFAIKTLNPMQQSQGNFQEKQEQFVNEALRLRGCQHPHIVKVYEVIQEAGLWGMVMEYVNGDDLGVYVDRHGQLSESEALRYINQVGQALEYVHQQGFLHRDIKPNNIILRDKKQEAVLIDFGLAREFTIGRTLSMTNSKTNGYAPIEQYERQGRFGTYTDVYALAATLYSLLSGKTPIPANYRKDGDIALKAPKQFNSDISDRVNDAIIIGMALEVQDRPQTVGKWLQLLMPNQPKVERLQGRHDEIQLKTVGIDYTRMRDLLTAGKWKEANKETIRVMLTAAGKKREGRFDSDCIHNFSCQDLRIIDNFWVKYSNGQFGFSVQKRIYQSLKGTTRAEKILEAFADHIGWRKKGKWLRYYTDCTFDLKAPLAHLPVIDVEGVTIFPSSYMNDWMFCFRDGMSDYNNVTISLLSHMENCEI